MGDPFGIRWFLPLKGTMIDETVNKLSKEMCIVIHEKDEYYVFSNKQDNSCINIEKDTITIIVH